MFANVEQICLLEGYLGLHLDTFKVFANLILRSEYLHQVRKQLLN